MRRRRPLGSASAGVRAGLPSARPSVGKVIGMRGCLSGVSLLLLLGGAHASVELKCQVFDETMVCDNERLRLSRAEIRTCSG